MVNLDAISTQVSTFTFLYNDKLLEKVNLHCHLPFHAI